MDRKRSRIRLALPLLCGLLVVSLLAGAAAVTAGTGKRAGAAKVKRGTPGRDRLVGTRRRDRLFGRSGNDRLSGRGGNDLLDGGRGNDRLNGGSGRDRLKGGRGRDRLKGGSGRDRFSGGPGNDVIDSAEPARRSGARASARAERIDCGSGRDRVTADAGDRVRRCESVRRVDRNGRTPGNTVAPYEVEVRLSGTENYFGGGRVTSGTKSIDGKQIDCRVTRSSFGYGPPRTKSGVCSGKFKTASVGLVAEPFEGSYIAGISSQPATGTKCQSADDLGACLLRASSSRRTVTVLINLQRVTLTIHNPDMANGRVGSTPQLPFHNGAKCGIGMNICSVDYWYGFGARFTLGHQPPITGGKLSGCTYGDQTPGNDCVEVMNGPQSVTAQWEY